MSREKRKRRQATEFSGRNESSAEQRTPEPGDDRLLEAVAEWLAAPAPGVDRVELLVAPPLPATRPGRRSAVRRLRQFAWHGAIAVIVFVAGFGSGRLSGISGDRRSPVKIESAALSPSSSPVPVPTPAATSGVDEETTLASPEPMLPVEPAGARPTPPGNTEAIEVADSGAQGPAAAPTTQGSAPLRYSTDEQGRVHIETSLASSGGRAVWVVDGGFQLAQAAAKSEREIRK